MFFYVFWFRCCQPSFCWCCCCCWCSFCSCCGHQQRPLQRVTFAQLILLSHHISISSGRWGEREGASAAAAAAADEAANDADAAAGWLVTSPFGYIYQCIARFAPVRGLNTILRWRCRWFANLANTFNRLYSNRKRTRCFFRLIRINRSCLCALFCGICFTISTGHTITQSAARRQQCCKTRTYSKWHALRYTLAQTGHTGWCCAP